MEHAEEQHESHVAVNNVKEDQEVWLCVIPSLRPVSEALTTTPTANN